jgi:hypothetical protein
VPNTAQSSVTGRIGRAPVVVRRPMTSADADVKDSPELAPEHAGQSATSDTQCSTDIRSQKGHLLKR